MSDKLPQGQAMKDAKRAADHRLVRANKAKERLFVRDTELTAAELEEVQPRLKREAAERRARREAA